MAYAQRYLIQNQGKSFQIFTLEIYERDYTGGTIEQIAADLDALIHKLITDSDDPFQPIVASTLNLKADISDYTDTLPDFQTTDDRKYFVKLKSNYQLGDNKAAILWRAYQSVDPIYLDSNLQITVDGAVRVLEFVNNTGSLIIDAGDSVLVELAVFEVPGVVPVGGGWKLQVQADGVDIYNVTTSVPILGATLSFAFTALTGVVYSVLCESYQAGDPGPAIPDDIEYKIWKGFILSDDARLRHSTGYLPLAIGCVDGLAILKNIEYQPPFADINRIGTGLDHRSTIMRCLNAIEYPDGFFLNIAVSIFANGMVDRIADPAAEPFSQIWVPSSQWVLSPGKFKDCYTILTEILKPFGASLIQSAGEFWIIDTNDRALDTVYFTRLDETNTVTGSGVRKMKYTIKPYTTGIQDPYFVDDTQIKIVKKGFTVVNTKFDYTYPQNMIDNGNLIRRDATGLPDSWSKTSLVTYGSIGLRYAFQMDVSVAAGGTSATANADSIANIALGSKLSVTFDMETDENIGPVMQYRLEVLIIINDGTNLYYWTDDNGGRWRMNPGVGVNKLYRIEQAGQVSIQTNPVPVGGVLSFKVQTTRSATMYISRAGNFKMTATASTKSVTSTASTGETIGTGVMGTSTIQLINPHDFYLGRAIIKGDGTNDWQDTYVTIIAKTAPDTYTITEVLSRNVGGDVMVQDFQYEKNIDVTFGGVNVFRQSIKGMLLSVPFGDTLTTWYRQSSPSDTYTTLIELLTRKLSDVFSRASINMEMTLENLFCNKVGDITGLISPVDTFLVQDDPAGPLSVNGKTYVLTNAAFNYDDNTLQSTLVETRDSDADADTVISNYYEPQ